MTEKDKQTIAYLESTHKAASRNQVDKGKWLDMLQELYHRHTGESIKRNECFGCGGGIKKYMRELRAIMYK